LIYTEHMKFYIATRVLNEHNRNLAIKLKAFLEKAGHSNTFDWMNYKEDIKPYLKNVEKASVFAKRDIDAVIEADFFIIIADPDGRGMYVELGAAIASRKKIFIIGEPKDSSVFNFYPGIKWVSDKEEILNNL